MNEVSVEQTYRVMEAYCDDDGIPGNGREIAKGLTIKQAEEMLERLYAPDRQWWKETEGE